MRRIFIKFRSVCTLDTRMEFSRNNIIRIRGIIIARYLGKSSPVPDFLLPGILSRECKLFNCKAYECTKDLDRLSFLLREKKLIHYFENAKMWKIENCVQSIFHKRIRFLILFPNDRVPVIIKILKNRVEDLN